MNDKQFSGRKMRPLCLICGDTFSPRRAVAGYKICLLCGEDAAREERKHWTVIQPYGKGNYQFVTAHAAAATLRGTNQKQQR